MKIVKNTLLIVRIAGNIYQSGVTHALRFALTMILAITSISAWPDSADVSVGINLSPIPKNAGSIPPGFKLNLISYDKDEYLLAYNVFVMNGSVDLAFEVASAAVKQRPKSIFWRKKLVNVALWSGRGGAALEQLMYFINNNITPELYVKDALKLAGQLNDYDAQATLLHRELQNDPKNKQLIISYSTALQNQGYPTEALKFLEQVPNVENDPDYLELLINIAKGFDNPAMEAKYLQKMRMVNPKAIKPAMDYAQFLYMKGDINGAYAVYHTMAAAPDNKIIFWRNYAMLSLLTGKNDSAIDAYKHLVEKDAMDNASLLQMISLEVQAGHKENAYRDATNAYQTTANPVLIPVILSLGEQLQKWQEMKRFITHIPAAELTRLQEKPEFAILIINLNVHLGLMTEARKAWEWVFQRWPNVTLVQRAYLWFLIDANDLRQLEYTLIHWHRILEQKSELWQVYASGLTNVGDYPSALRIMLRHKSELSGSYEILTNLADLLTQNDKFYAAYYTAQKALYLLRRQINAQSGRLSIEQHMQLTELTQLFGSASMTYNLVLHLNKKLFTNERVDHQVMSWALKSRSYDLAKYIAAIHKLYNISTPPWMTLTLALVYHDRDAMADMLFHYPKRLPHRDRVMAAINTGNIKLGEEYAYIGLKEHPQDYEMYKLFEDVMLPRANKFSVKGGFYNVGSVGGPYTGASLRYFVTPSIAVMPYTSLWFPGINDPEQLAWAPNLNQLTGIAVRKYIEKGWIQGSIAERSSMENFFVGKLKLKQKLTRWTDALFALNYHAIASETDTLVVGGMKNEAVVSLNTVWDSYNTLTSEFKVEQYLGQDETFLGTGEELQFRWQHKFYLSYPDWNINYYATWANYQNSNDALSPKLLRFVPVGTTAGTEFFMPISYTEGGITVGFGQDYKENYTHPWRWFGEAGLIYSFPFGLGELIQGGLGGSVFGRDHLALYAEYSFNQQQASQRNYTIGIRYDNYF